MRLLVATLVLALSLGVSHAGLLGWTPNWTLGDAPARLIEVPAAAPVGTTPCPGVRPGAIVASDVGQCSFNFAPQVKRAADVLGIGLTLQTAPAL